MTLLILTILGLGTFTNPAVALHVRSGSDTSVSQAPDATLQFEREDTSPIFEKFGNDMSTCQASYWSLEQTQTPSCAEPIPNKYVLFDLDHGALSNIKYGFMYAAQAACTTGRTLVLPPAAPMWMLDWGPNSHLGDLDEQDNQFRMPTTVSRLEDFFDMSASGLASALPVITFNEFWSREHVKLSLPDEWGSNESTVLAKMHCETYSIQGDRLKSVYAKEKNGAKRGLYWQVRGRQVCEEIQNTKVTDLQYFGTKQFWTVKNQCPLDATGAMLSAKQDVLYFPMDPKMYYKHQWSYKRLFDCQVPGNQRAQYNFLKSNIPFHPSIVKAGKNAIATFSGDAEPFVALHYRAKEFDQYDRSDTPQKLASFLTRFANCGQINAPRKLYVASDQPKKWFTGSDQSWPSVSNLDAIFLDDVRGSAMEVLRETSDVSDTTWKKLSGPIEQTILTHASAFIGSYMSTYSATVADTLVAGHSGFPLFSHTQKDFTKQCCATLQSALSTTTSGASALEMTTTTTPNYEVEILNRLHKAGVLCDANRPCTTELNGMVLKVCLPKTNDNGHVCEPFGEKWQRVGQRISDAFGASKCESFDLQKMLDWQRTIRSSPPLINQAELASKISEKSGGGAKIKQCVENIIAKTTDTSLYQPQRLSHCAFVGSGGIKNLGAEIDAHDAVFRANTHITNFSAYSEDVGKRMDFVSNCLYNNQVPQNVQTCVVPSAWWNQKVNSESFNNEPLQCCRPELRSSWTCGQLEQISNQHSMVFHNFKKSGVRAVDVQLLGSGGSALHMALSMCDKVDVYGVGFTNLGFGKSKLYQHYYDPSVRGCESDASFAADLDPDLVLDLVDEDKGNDWLRDRMSSEILYQVYDMLQIVNLIPLNQAN